MTDDTEPEQRPAHLFKPGQSGNPKGRPKGARSVLATDFLNALQKDFAEHGEAAIAEVREDKPDQYLRTIASILPREIEPSEQFIDLVHEITRRVVE